jgi:hypothetical protein
VEAAAVIELDLLEPEFEDLTLFNVDGVRGDEDGVPEIEPLKGRVSAGGPHGFRLTSERLAADRELSQFLDENADYEYYFVFLAVSFKALGSPKLGSAEVKLSLTANPEGASPFALSMKPLTDGDQVSVKRTASLGPNLKLLDAVDVSVGSIEREQSFTRTDLVVRGEGLASAYPKWVFTRTAARKLEGSCMLTMVVRANHGAAVSVSGVVTARTTGNLIWHFARDLPNPLELAAVL